MTTCEKKIIKDFKAGKISAIEKESRLDYCSMYSGYDGDAPQQKEWEAIITTPRCITEPCEPFTTGYKHVSTDEVISVADYNKLFNVPSVAVITTDKVALNTAINEQKSIPTIAKVASLGLLIVAIYLAYKQKKGAWGYVGYILLAGLVSTGFTKVATDLNNKKLNNLKAVS